MAVQLAALLKSNFSCEFFWEFSEQLFFRADVSSKFFSFPTKLGTSSCDLIIRVLMSQVLI